LSSRVVIIRISFYLSVEVRVTTNFGGGIAIIRVHGDTSLVVADSTSALRYVIVMELNEIASRLVGSLGNLGHLGEDVEFGATVIIIATRNIDGADNGGLVAGNKYVANELITVVIARIIESGSELANGGISKRSEIRGNLKNFLVKLLNRLVERPATIQKIIAHIISEGEFDVTSNVVDNDLSSPEGIAQEADNTSIELENTSKALGHVVSKALVEFLEGLNDVVIELFNIVAGEAGSLEEGILALATGGISKEGIKIGEFGLFELLKSFVDFFYSLAEAVEDLFNIIEGFLAAADIARNS
jgi:hypothetical protein